MQKEGVETKTAKIYLTQDGILHAVYKAGSEVTLKDAKENIMAASQVLAGGKAPFLVDISSVRSVDGGARSYW